MADVTVTAASVLAPTARKRTGTAGVAITAGQVVYRDAADKLFKLGDADATGVGAITKYYIALNGAAAGQPLVVVESGNITFNAALTAGTAYYLSPNPGGIAPLGDVLSGDNVILLGLARSTTVLAFAPIISGVTLG
jgi:hypothetical protein